MCKKGEKKPKKEKIIYIDDGSTISDMSAFRRNRKPSRSDDSQGDDDSLPRWRQILNTYFDSVRLMLLPTLAFGGIIALAFLIVWILFRFAA